MSVVALLVAVTLLWTPNALAHSFFSADSEKNFAAAVTALVVLGVWALYAFGARRSPAKRWRQVVFHGSALITVFTIFGPLDAWAESSSSAHMTQHMILMVVIAPLFALAKPLPQFFVASGGHGRTLWNYAFKITRYPMFCAYIHGFMIWFWHIPVLYMLAVVNSWVHVLAHASFLITAVWFWWACLHANTRKAPFALLALLFTLMHTGFLGALLTFANAPLYAEARHIQDQQLAGLIMWVLGGIPYIAASLWAGNRWYKQLNRRMLAD